MRYNLGILSYKALPRVLKHRGSEQHIRGATVSDYTPEHTPSKRCPKCGVVKPYEKFGKDKSTKDGFTWQCRECRRKYKAQEIYNSIRTETEKLCSTCGKFKPYTDFSEDRRRKDGRQASCRICARERVRKWQAANPERFMSNVHASVHRRMARKRELPARFNIKDWRRCLDYWNGCCAYCGNPPGLWHVMAIEHFVPLSNPNCPGTIPENILPACHAKKGGSGGCNNTKIGRDTEQWLIEKFGKRKAQKILARIHVYFDYVKELKS